MFFWIRETGPLGDRANGRELPRNLGNSHQGADDKSFDEVQKLARFVLPHFKDGGIQPVNHPTHSRKLFWNVGSPIEPIRQREQFTRFFKPYAAPGTRSKTPALPKVEAKAHVISL
jgi:hypothetical protein